MEKIVFVDRDGVINRDPGVFGKKYVTEWAEFEFLPGVLDALRKLTENGFKIAVISNQAGISKGVYSREKLEEITQKMLDKIEASGGKIFSVQYCAHRDEDNCDCRKPKTGLFKRAAEGHKVDFTKTYFVGDTKNDMEAGKNIGCRTIVVLSGKVTNEKEVLAWPIRPDFIKKDLREAAEVILCAKF